MKNIGVIGSGAAGLCAARHILANNGLTPVVWEQSEKVGGTWNYTPETGTDKHGLPIHSSMYQNLKTNLPKEVMAFPDFPFPESNESFLHHSQVLKYLECYAENFDLYPYIKFSHHVEEVKPIFKDVGPPSWSVKAKDLNSNESTTTICDALLVCNGHYSVPRMPAIKDIEKFKGLQIHSHNYREPTPFKGLRIVVLGAAASGLDIMLELASQAKEIFLSHNLPVPIPSDLPSNVRQVRGVTAATENGFIIADGNSIDADVIVYCTGYEYTFPFLSEECNVTIEENIVKPLYKHLIHSSFPSLAFVGIPFQVCPFPLFDFQVQFFLKTIMGQFTLPSKKEMEEITMKDLEGHQNDGLPSKHFHKMGNIQWPYNDQLAKKSGIAPLPPVVAKLYMAVSQSRKSNLMSYKTASYKITDADSFVRVRYFTKVLCGALVLPSKQEMDADTHKEYEYRKNIGLRDKHFHKMAKLHWKYSDSIAQAAGLKPMPYSVKTLYDTIHSIRRKTINYKKRCFRIIDEDNYEELYKKREG